MNKLLYQLYMSGTFVKITPSYYEYEYRSLRLKLYYDKNDTVFKITGSNRKGG